MDSVNYNGQISPAEQALSFSGNRAFSYGDGLFETMRVFQGKILFLNRHWQRLQKGMEWLHLRSSQITSGPIFLEECRKLIPDDGNYRLRFSLWRAGAGLYTPTSIESDFLIQIYPLPADPYPLNEEGLDIDLYPEVLIETNFLSNLKTINALPYVMASIYKQENDLDDCLLINRDRRIVEASSSNLFIIVGNKLLTPPLADGCIDGVMRSVILDIAYQIGLKTEEVRLREEDLFSADELFLSNSIQGIKWVTRYKNRNFDRSKIELLYKQLNFFIR